MPFDTTLPASAVLPVFSRVFGSWHIAIGRTPYAQPELRDHYDKAAGLWQNKIAKFGFQAAYAGLLHKVLRQPRYAQTASRLRVLDIGIGTGAMSAALCDVTPQPVLLHGIDISHRMLERAAQHLGDTPVDLCLKAGDVTRLPYDPGTFDVVMAAHVLEHMSNPTEVLTQCYRVLKPGGVLVLCVTKPSTFGVYIQLVWRTRQIGMIPMLGALRGCGFLSARAVPLCKNSFARHASIGYVARKPKEPQSRTRQRTGSVRTAALARHRGHGTS